MSLNVWTNEPWYQDHLAIKEVRDHFFIEDDVMSHCLEAWADGKYDLAVSHPKKSSPASQRAIR